MTAPLVDWAALRAAAVAATGRAYVPYSGFRVGAAGVTDDGQLFVGCNVENASYGLTLCAECGLVSAYFAGVTFGAGTGDWLEQSLARAAGATGRLIAVAVCGPEGDDIAPCGRCRQLLLEIGGADLLVNEHPMSDWLPGAFGAADLAGPD